MEAYRAAGGDSSLPGVPLSADRAHWGNGVNDWLLGGGQRDRDIARGSGGRGLHRGHDEDAAHREVADGSATPRRRPCACGAYCRRPPALNVPFRASTARARPSDARGTQASRGRGSNEPARDRRDHSHDGLAELGKWSMRRDREDQKRGTSAQACKNDVDPILASPCGLAAHAMAH